MLGADHFSSSRIAARVSVPRPARPELLGLVAITSLLNLWRLSGNGFTNGYYAAAVRSMTLSWHNFLFGSFDPAGVMTVDKPPLALWVQALSARVFGYNPWSTLVPEALMGIGTVVLTYDLVRRRFGRVGGFIGGLALAVTPITIAMSRHDNPDSLLIVCCVAALWFAMRGLEDGRTRWIVWSGVMVGLGFEAKMGTALLVVPGIAAAWMWASPHGLAKRVRQLLTGGMAMIVVGATWPLLVALTPAADRPWISGTNDNSIWSLITGYNGLGRITGQSASASGIGTGSSGGGGNPGVLRLLNSALGVQGGWLLGFSIVSALGLVALTRMRRRDDITGWALAVGGAFLTAAVAFSAAQGIFRPYYVAFLAPFAAALAGAGVAQIARGDQHARRLAPVAIAGGIATEVAVLHSARILGWLDPIIICTALASTVALVLVTGARRRLVALGAVLASLAIAPAAWRLDTGGHVSSGAATTGSVRATSAGSAGHKGVSTDRVFDAALGYVRSHGRGTLAISSQAQAEIEIIPNGAALAGIGGFSGSQSAVTAGWLAQEIHLGRIGWVLVTDAAARSSSGSADADIGGYEADIAGSTADTGSADAMHWAVAACRQADSFAAFRLYDCSGRAARVLQSARRNP